MIEAYAFLAAFAVQILAASVLYPAGLIRYVRGWARNFGSERFAQLYPGVDYSRWVERFVTGYRAAKIVIAILGLLLLRWLYTLIQHPDWTSEVGKPTLLYFFLQMSPWFSLACTRACTTTRCSRSRRRGEAQSRPQRRGLFDFVSPFVVSFAVLTYFLFVAYAIYRSLCLSQRPCKACLGPSARSAGLRIECVHHLQEPVRQEESACDSRWPRAHDQCDCESGRLRRYHSRLVLSVFGTLGQPGLQQWRPFALTVFPGDHLFSFSSV
jgi:hypothetical protein